MKEKHTIRSVSEFNNELKLKGFNAFQIESDGNATHIYSKKDFYKICLTTDGSAGSESLKFLMTGWVVMSGSAIGRAWAL